jgi:hypothetical protein
MEKMDSARPGKEKEIARIILGGVGAALASAFGGGWVIVMISVMGVAGTTSILEHFIQERQEAADTGRLTTYLEFSEAFNSCILRLRESFGDKFEKRFPLFRWEGI